MAPPVTYTKAQFAATPAAAKPGATYQRYLSYVGKARATDAKADARPAQAPARAGKQGAPSGLNLPIDPYLKPQKPAAISSAWNSIANLYGPPNPAYAAQNPDDLATSASGYSQQFAQPWIDAIMNVIGAPGSGGTTKSGGGTVKVPKPPRPSSGGGGGGGGSTGGGGTPATRATTSISYQQTPNLYQPDPKSAAALAGYLQSSGSQAETALQASLRQQGMDPAQIAETVKQLTGQVESQVGMVGAQHASVEAQRKLSLGPQTVAVKTVTPGTPAVRGGGGGGSGSSGASNQYASEDFAAYNAAVNGQPPPDGLSDYGIAAYNYYASKLASGSSSSSGGGKSSNSVYDKALAKILGQGPNISEQAFAQLIGLEKTDRSLSLSERKGIATLGANFYNQTQNRDLSAAKSRQGAINAYTSLGQKAGQFGVKTTQAAQRITQSASRQSQQASQFTARQSQQASQFSQRQTAAQTKAEASVDTKAQAANQRLLDKAATAARAQANKLYNRKASTSGSATSQLLGGKATSGAVPRNQASRQVAATVLSVKPNIAPARLKTIVNGALKGAGYGPPKIAPKPAKTYPGKH
jgi:hypothetical protein